MIAGLTFLMLAAQSAEVAELAKRGADVYRMHCSVPYCHGAGGTAGRAPALGGKNYDRTALRNIVANGTRSGMPAFRSALDEPSLNAVVAYVLALPAPAGAPSGPARPAPQLPRSAYVGRDLFFDSSRMPSCSACHEAGGKGGNIGKPLTAAAVPLFSDLKRVAAASAVVAKPDGEKPFAALLIRREDQGLRLVDLDAPLPVVRTLPPATVLEPAPWNHAPAFARYTPAELKQISTFLLQIQDR